MTPKIFPTVTIVIPTRDRVNSLLETLTSISKLDYPKNKLEVIIIDNKSSIPIYSNLKTLKTALKIKIIRNNTNRGFAPALNQGIRKSKGKHIFITNDDVIFDKNCLSELVKCAESEPKIAVVGGKMLFRDNKKMALPGFKVNIWLGYHPYDYAHGNEIREMDVATGGCMLINSKLMKSFGLFDEGFFFCGEDYDFCFRAKYVGYKTIYCPMAVCYHEFLASGAKKQNFGHLFAHYRGKFRFMLIHASLIQLLFFVIIQIVLGPIFSYIQSKQVTILPIMLALGWNIINLPSAIKSRNKVELLKRKFKYI